MSEPSTDNGSAPTVYLFFGDDDFAMAEAVHSLTSKFDDPSGADMNTERFDATDLAWSKFVEVSTSMPFLAERRLIIVDNASKLVSRAEDRERALALFSSLPPTTRLVLLDSVELRGRDPIAQYKKRSHLYTWAQEHPKSSYSQPFVKPTGPAFVHWVIQRVKGFEGDISNQAAQRLAEAVAEDLYLADQEIQKLLAYVDYRRPIESADVERLTPLYRQSDVFAMVDAVGARDATQALAHLHELLQSEDPRYAFAMIARQFRLLLQAKEALIAGKDPKSALSLHPYVAGKVARQARNFKLAQLETTLHQLYQLDLNSKTGRAELNTALDQLIVRLAS